MPLMRHPALKAFGLFALCFALALAVGPARATEPQAAKPAAPARRPTATAAVATAVRRGGVRARRVLMPRP